MAVYERVFVIKDPEGWLETNQIMDMINSEDFQDSVCSWVVGSWEEEEFEGDIPWSLALKQIMNWLDQGINRMRKKCDWKDVIRYALANCSNQDMKDCGLFWIAHYALIKGLVSGKIRIQYCLLSSELDETEQDGVF